MKVALGNLGPLTFALKTSLEELDIEVCVPQPNSISMHKLAQKYMTSEMCYPLKLLLGNYLSLSHHKADAVIFYSGCDVCNLAPINYAYTDIFNELGWFPETYFCNINSKKSFILSYINMLRRVSDKPWYNIIKSISLGVKKFETLNYIDQVFYSIRPAFSDMCEVEHLYSKYHSSIVAADSSKKIKEINTELYQNYNEYYFKLPSDVLRIGLIGDTYSIAEPFAHQFVDKQLGHMGVIVDRWSQHNLLPDSILKTSNNNGLSLKLSNIVKNNYGVLTSLELTKLSRYIDRGYDGIVYVSPLECNPSDAIRNYLSKIQNELNIPIMSLVFDEHTNSMAVSARLEAFVDILKVSKLSKTAFSVAL